MATKKQKRAAALAKREAFIEGERARGKKAREAAQKKRDDENRRIEMETLKKKRSRSTIEAVNGIRGAR